MLGKRVVREVIVVCGCVRGRLCSGWGEVFLGGE